MAKRDRWYSVDTNTGMIHRARDMRVDWDGSIRHKDNLDGKHPAFLERRYPEPQQPQDELVSYPGDRQVFGPAFVTAVSLTAYGTVGYYTAGSNLPDSWNPPKPKE